MTNLAVAARLHKLILDSLHFVFFQRFSQPLALLIFFFFHSSIFICSSAQEVVFSHDGGFYADTFSLAMELRFAPAESRYTIHYTLNGAEPTECDALYTAPLRLSADCYAGSDFYSVQTVPDDRWFAPREVEHAIVVRAAAFDSAGYRQSAVTTHTYLVDSLLGRRIALPVVSLCADSLSLFDRDTGIFVPGFCYDPLYPYSSGNYFQKGRHWERAAVFAYYDPAGCVVEQDCGLRAHGNSQRVLVQKGMSLYARREYGDSRFRLCQRLADPLRCDNLATRPVVLFLNGEYWGIYFLEEKADEHYVEEHYGVADEEVDLLAYWGNEVENGSRRRWSDFAAWLEKADTRRQQDYDQLASQVDIDAVMDYMLLQILILNDD